MLVRTGLRLPSWLSELWYGWVHLMPFCVIHTYGSGVWILSGRNSPFQLLGFQPQCSLLCQWKCCGVPHSKIINNQWVNSWCLTQIFVWSSSAPHESQAWADARHHQNKGHQHRQQKSHWDPCHNCHHILSSLLHKLEKVTIDSHPEIPFLLTCYKDL